MIEFFIMKKRVVVHIFIVFLIALNGCSFLGKKNPGYAKKKSLLEYGKVINIKKLSQGGNVLLVPFSSGKGVEASEEIDKIAQAN